MGKRAEGTWRSGIAPVAPCNLCPSFAAVRFPGIGNSSPSVKAGRIGTIHPGDNGERLVQGGESARLDPDRGRGILIWHPQPQRRGRRSPSLLHESTGAGGEKVEQLRDGPVRELGPQGLQNVLPG